LHGRAWVDQKTGDGQILATPEEFDVGFARFAFPGKRTLCVAVTRFPAVFGLGIEIGGGGLRLRSAPPSLKPIV
jgi:hypothetical protein